MLSLATRICVSSTRITSSMVKNGKVSFPARSRAACRLQPRKALRIGNVHQVDMADAAHEASASSMLAVSIRTTRFSIAGKGKQSGAGSPAHFRLGSPSPLSRSITSARVSSMKLKSPIAVAPSASANLKRLAGPAPLGRIEGQRPQVRAPRPRRRRREQRFLQHRPEKARAGLQRHALIPARALRGAVLARLGRHLNAGGVRAFHHGPVNLGRRHGQHAPIRGWRG